MIADENYMILNREALPGDEILTSSGQSSIAIEASSISVDILLEVVRGWTSNYFIGHWLEE